jgi:hypothetical protein
MPKVPKIMEFCLFELDSAAAINLYRSQKNTLGTGNSKRLGQKSIINVKAHHGLLDIESIVLKTRSKILGTLGILNFRHLLNTALRSIN